MSLGALAARVQPPATAPDRADAFASLVAHAVVHSPYLRRLVGADAERLADLAAASPEASAAAICASQDAVAASFADGTLDRAGAMRAMRRNKDAAALLIALADLGGVWPVETATAALADFADASVRAAVAIALSEAVAAGRIGTADPENSGFVVLAYGKHGAGELNYSSDIDLVVFHDPAAPAAGSDASRLYTRLAQTVSRLLSERTVEGYVHRVDYRLRPDPASTPVSVSLPSAYGYYETVGQNWERAAMIKARPVAGELALGDRFLADMQPFIWRKYFDFASIADIHAMKRQIHAVRGYADSLVVEGHDVKLGRGGIREIEFFVQTQQLVFGGRRPALRGRRTLDMLPALHAEGWIDADARDEMAEAYRFLREVEHRLQMVEDEQTQRLPVDPAALDGFARFCGHPDRAAFAEALTARAGRVQAHYALLFREGEELASDRGDLVFTGADLDPATVGTLGRLGFREPERAAETVRGWHFGRRPAVTTARARQVLTELVPSLLAALGGTGDPDAALRRLDEAFGRMPAAVELLTILRSHDKLRTLFADLLGSAPRLAETVAARPHVLDAVLDPGFTAPIRDDDAVEAQLGALVGRASDTEDFLDRLRDANRELHFATSARLLSAVLTPAEAGSVYAAIARAAIRIALAWTFASFAGEHGRVPGGRIAVLGLGRLGAGNLTAASDLDLVVLYDFDEARRTSDGARPLDAVPYYTRLAQRLVAALTVPTRRGTLFEVDLRLRPSGRKGPLATQFGGFRAYQAGEAQTWEHMALTRARVLAGDADLGLKVAAAIREVVAQPRDETVLFSDVATMRALIETEKGLGDPWSLKIAPGGLVDLDFLAQAIVLADAESEPGLVGLATPALFEAAAATGRLRAEHARRLVAAHALVDSVVHWQRLVAGDDGATELAVRARIAALAGEPGPDALRVRLDEARAFVRGVFREVLATDLVAPVAVEA